MSHFCPKLALATGKVPDATKGFGSLSRWHREKGRSLATTLAGERSWFFRVESRLSDVMTAITPDPEGLGETILARHGLPAWLPTEQTVTVQSVRPLELSRSSGSRSVGGTGAVGDLPTCPVHRPKLSGAN